MLFKVKYCIPVHDEINAEAPEAIATVIAEKLKSCMVKAGEKFCTRCHLDADISWEKYKDSEGKEQDLPGVLPNHWIH